MNNTARSGNSIFHFRFAVVYSPIYALGRILNLVFLFFFQYCVFGYRINHSVTFWRCFPIIYIHHGRIGINTAFWGWLSPDIPSRDPQIITSNLRFSVMNWRFLDGISGHNHPKYSIYSLNDQWHSYVCVYYNYGGAVHVLCIHTCTYILQISMRYSASIISKIHLENTSCPRKRNTIKQTQLEFNITLV